MPMLGDVFIDTVYSENPSGAVDVTEHPVEDGVNIADHVKKNAKTMSISGVITGPDASARKSKLEKYMNEGKLLRYSYRNQMSNVIIGSFDTTHDADVKGGLKFSMTLMELRIAKPTIIRNLPQKAKPKQNKGLQQPKGSTPAKVYIVKSGDNLTRIGRNHGGISWRKIYDKNKGLIGSNPDSIYPGQKLIIPA